MHRRYPCPRYLISFHTRRLPQLTTDVLVLGTGVAGMRAAIEAAQSGRVLLCTKAESALSNTYLAQGGIAAALHPADSIREHFADTVAGAHGLSDRRIARLVVEEGRDRVRELIRWGVRFDRRGKRLRFAQEGGHRKARILHAGGDATGKEIYRALAAKVLETAEIQILERSFAIDLLTHRGRCVGALLHQAPRGFLAICARAVVLASGGAGQLYRETTNPPVATGDGMAMAFRAGAQLEDLEFVQYHPTTFYVAGSSRALISEAVRGEGAHLTDRHGRRFMVDFHPRAELAPRDVVSRAIVCQMRETGDTSAYLDLTQLPASRVRRRFPQLAELCQQFRIDLTRDRIPVRPSAHYFLGGVRTDRRGRTALPGLYACGEVANSHFHGANRLGSNSLLEGLVFGKIAGHQAGKARGGSRGLPPLRYARPESMQVKIDQADMRNSLKSLMWRKVGVEREAAGLREAIKRIDYWAGYVLDREFDSPQGWELQNMLVLARGVAKAALLRTESRGVHVRSDFPERDDQRWHRHLSFSRR